MAVFGRKEEEPVTTSTDEATKPDPTAPKGKPTPKRRDQQAARRQPLVPQSTPRRKMTPEQKEAVRKERERARLGLMNGEEKFLGPRDKGVQRRFVRDWVDARFSIGEIFIPLALVVLLMGMLNNAQIQMAANLGVWVVILLVVGDCVLLCLRMRRAMKAKFGTDALERGLNFYAVMRAVQMRRLRLPKPQVKRGEYPR